MSDLNGLRHLYAQTASFYESQVIPAFAPLAKDFAAWALRCAADHLQYELFDPFDSDNQNDSASSESDLLKKLNVIDLGTGTGIMARTLAARVHSVLGVDVSPAMLNVAQRFAPPNVALIQADLHTLPLQHSFAGLIVSSFGLNASTPKPALRSIANTLRKGKGMFAFQEWSVEDECSQILEETLKAHTPEDAPALDEPIQAFYAAPKPWYDQLQDTEDYYEALKHSGFDMVWVKEAAFVSVHLPNIGAFGRYKLAWPGRRFTVEAMTPQQQLDFERALIERLSRFANPDGTFDWAPHLFRVFATR